MKHFTGRLKQSLSVPNQLSESFQAKITLLAECEMSKGLNIPIKSMDGRKSLRMFKKEVLAKKGILTYTIQVTNFGKYRNVKVSGKDSYG